MKKFLSLVLALVMTMSLVTVSAGAKDFTDDSEITYKEAVDVISALGVVDGYSGGDFRPDDVLTRGAAAKIICNLILGPTTASALSAGTAPFKDVPVTNTFAGYITYCSQQGIISGYADGTFRPTGTLSGNAFMKMLLGALGYDSSIEGYTGPTWQVSVIKQAVGIGLDDGNDEFVGSKAVTRQEAALYAFNMLQATMVEYDQQNTIVVGDITINTTSSRKDVVNNDKNESISEDNKMQFAERYFDDLKLSDGDDAFGRPSNVWTLKSDEIGTYAKDADATYTAKVEAGDIYKDLGLSDTVDKTDVTVFIDGADKTDDNALAIRKGSDTKVGDSANGVLTEVYYDDDKGDITITQVKTYIGEISKSVEATDKRDAYVEVITTVDSNGNKPAGASGSEKFETAEKFDDEAKVLYTFSESEDEIQSVVLAEEATGTVSKVVNKTNDQDNSSVTVNDTEYKASATMASSLLSAISVDLDYTIYLDTYGYVISVSEEDYSDYALVLEIEGSKDTGFKTDRAKLVLTDGSVKTVDLSKDYKNDKSIDQYDIVTYKVDEDNEYVLKEVKLTQSVTNSATFDLENDVARITTGGSSNSKNTVYANSKTMFVVRDDSKDYTAYTGVKNAPSVKAQDLSIGGSGIDNAKEQVSAYWYCKSGDIVTAMFIIPGSDALVTDENNNMLFLAGESATDIIHDRTGDYYEYQAVVDNEVKTVKVDWTVKLDGTPLSHAQAGALNGLFSRYSVDKDGIITSLYTYDTTNTNNKFAGYGVGTDRNSADYTVTVLNGTDSVITSAKNTGIWTVDDDAKFFEIDEDGNVETGTYGSVTKDDDDRAYFVIENGMVIYMFVEEVNSKDDAQAAKVEITGEKDVTIGASLTLTANVTLKDPKYDRVTGYQWYYTDSPANYGSSVADIEKHATKIPGATSATYTVDTSAALAGRYFYCVVETYNDKVDGKDTAKSADMSSLVKVTEAVQTVNVAVYYSTDGTKDAGKVVGTEVLSVTAQGGVLVTVSSSDLKNIPVGYKLASVSGLPAYVTVGDKAEVIVTVEAKSNDTKPVIGSFTFNNVGGGSGASASSSFSGTDINVTVTPGSEAENDTLTATVTAPTGGTCDVSEIVLTYDGADWQITSGGTIKTIAEDGTSAQYTVTVA